MKEFKVKYISDVKSIFFVKNKEYMAHLPKDNQSGKFFAFYIEDTDEPGEYALPATRFEVIDS